MREKTWVFAYHIDGKQQELEIEGWSKWQAESDAANWIDRFAHGASFFLIRVV